MRADQLLKSLNHLKFKPASKHTATALGVSLRQLQRMTAGHVPVPRPVALLTISYLKHGVPNPLWNPEVEKIDVLQEASHALQEMAQAIRASSTPAPYVPPTAQKIEPATVAIRPPPLSHRRRRPTSPKQDGRSGCQRPMSKKSPTAPSESKTPPSRLFVLATVAQMRHVRHLGTNGIHVPGYAGKWRARRR
jgi:hypothetical protein